MVKVNQTATNDFPFEVEVIAENLFVPWAMVVSSDGRNYVTQRTGAIRVIENGVLLPDPLITLSSPFVSRGEGGLLGIALDPNYAENHYIYIMHTYTEGGTVYNRVVRLIEADNRAVIDQVIIDKIPGSLVHNGGRIKISPDQKLYIATGDAGNTSLSQDISSTAGKILRIELDGSIPADNPFPGSPVYSLGLRNPQGITWNTNGILYASEHGATAHDEINIIIPGGNYGWPLAQGEEVAQGIDVELPLISSNGTTWAPSGIAYVSQGPWLNKILVANLVSEQLLAIALGPEGNNVQAVDAWLVKQYGRLREVVQAEDGSIFLTTSNRDGRGSYHQGDDKVIRLRPIQ